MRSTIISTEDFNKINERSKVDQWDVIISMIGEYCGFCYVEKNPIVEYAVKNVGMFKVGDRLKALWLYYYLNSGIGRDVLNTHRAGTSQPYLTLGSLRSLPILLPHRKETMENVVAILSALDDKIELNRQTNATLEAIAQAIFKEWFVDFRFPGATGEMQDSELGPIPKGWGVRKLGDVCEKITKGTTPTTFGDKFIEEGIRFLRAECIQDNVGIDESKALFISPETHGKLKRSQLAQSDILITIAGAIGRAGIVTERILPANINQAIAIIRTDPSVLPPTYAFYHLRQQAVRDELLSGITQSVQANISLTDLNNLSLTIPKRALLDQFDNVVEGIRKHIENLTEQSTILIKVRDSLLPRLMNGEIEI